MLIFAIVSGLYLVRHSFLRHLQTPGFSTRQAFIWGRPLFENIRYARIIPRHHHKRNDLITVQCFLGIASSAVLFTHKPINFQLCNFHVISCCKATSYKVQAIRVQPLHRLCIATCFQLSQDSLAHLATNRTKKPVHSLGSSSMAGSPALTGTGSSIIW